MRLNNIGDCPRILAQRQDESRSSRAIRVPSRVPIRALFLTLTIISLFASQFLTPVIAPAYAADVSWLSDSSGNWSTPENWSSGTVPGPNDDVIIDRPSSQVTVTVNSGNITIKSLTATDALNITDGTFKITSQSTISGSFNLNGGAQLIATGASAEFTATGPANIDNGRFLITGGGKVFLPTVEGYDTSGITGNLTVISVKDAGSLLDLSSVVTMKAGFDYGGGGVYYHYFEALDNGTVDLSSVTELTSGAGDDWAKFTTTNGGEFIFTSLASIASRIWFDFDDASYAFSNVTSLNGNIFEVTAAGQTISFPLLTNVVGSSITVKAGAILNAPQLTSFTNSTLTLQGSGQFNSGMLTDITNARFFLTNGAVFDRVAATSYDTTGLLGNLTVISVKDAGSLLDLSSVVTMQAGFNYGGGGVYYHYFEAIDNGTVDLSAVTAITSGAGDDWAKFTTSNNGKFLFLSLSQMNSAARLWFEAQTNGHIDLSSVTEISPGYNIIKATDTGAYIDLHSLCTYTNTDIIQENGGIVDHQGIPITDFINHAFFAVRSIGQSTLCSGDLCSQSEMFTYLPDGRCMRDRGILKLGTTQVDIDGIAASPNYGVLAFQLIHNATSGIVESSRLVTVQYLNGTVTAVGPPLALKEGNTYHYVLGDHLGTPQKLIKKTGQVTWDATYDLFGKASVGTQTVSNPLRFPGQYADPESGLYQNFQRNYDPMLGAYAEQDPFGVMITGANRYGYAGGNPVGIYDPTGEIVPVIAVGLAILFAVDVAWTGFELYECFKAAQDNCLNPLFLESCQNAVIGAVLPFGVGKVAKVGRRVVPRLLPTSKIRFTQDSIRRTFSDGRKVDDLIAALKSGSLSPKDVTPIRIFEKNGSLYSLDNRRLFAAHEAGTRVNTVSATAEDIAKRRISTPNNGSFVCLRGKCD